MATKINLNLNLINRRRGKTGSERRAGKEGLQTKQGSLSYALVVIDKWKFPCLSIGNGG